MLLVALCAARLLTALRSIESALVLVVIRRVNDGVNDPQAFNSTAAHWLPLPTDAQRALESILIFPAPTLNSVIAAAPVAITPMAFWLAATAPSVV